MEHIIIKCPHCSQFIYIESKDLNCKIFRHGVFKHNNEQINPHLNKQECDRLKTENLIHGCGKPFKLTDNLNVEICDYI